MPSNVLGIVGGGIVEHAGSAGSVPAGLSVEDKGLD